jgi:hypothetical protein
MYDIAETLDLPLIDFTQVIGNNAQATAARLMADTVHENSKGYALEAAALGRVISPYQDGSSRPRAERSTKTSPVFRAGEICGDSAWSPRKGP